MTATTGITFSPTSATPNRALGGRNSKRNNNITGVNGHYPYNLNAGGHTKTTCGSLLARLLLAVACMWPICLWAIFTSSSRRDDAVVARSLNTGGRNEEPSYFQKQFNNNSINNIRIRFRDALDRVDIMGYGPTHPRVAVVLVGDDKNNLVASLESVFSTTDMNRIFVVVVVVDGHSIDHDLVQELKKIDLGAIPHWHGFRPDKHSTSKNKANDEGEDDPHGQKVHVMFNPDSLGISQCRKDAVDFVQALEHQHVLAGLKSEEEDLILLLLQGGSRLTSRTWLGPVTEALIVPPPILGTGDYLVSLKLANAVSFNIEGRGRRTSFDTTFTHLITETNPGDITLSSGASYPTPAFNGAAIAMRLNTYMNLPMQDMSLRDPWPANLDLALNLWLCADGIDMLRDIEVTAFERKPESSLPPEMAARFAAAWMDPITERLFYKLYTETYNKELTYLEWQTYQAKAQTVPSFTVGLPQKCRSFLWYVENVNPNLSKLLKLHDEHLQGQFDVNEVSSEADSEATPVQRRNVNTALLNTTAQDQLRDRVVAAILNETGYNEKNRQIKKNETSDGEIVTENEHSIKSTNSEIQDKPLLNSTIEGGDAVDTSLGSADKSRRPSKRLCEECLNIVQKAQQIDISYVDVRGTTLGETNSSTGLHLHPHMGARDVDGNWSYVHDETDLRKHPPMMNISVAKLKEHCETHDNNWRMIDEKVYVDLQYDAKMQESGNDRIKLFCLVYTTDIGHYKIPSIRQTWGPKCDGFMVGSNRTDRTIGAVDIPHAGEESYGNIWQKVRSMWSYVYDNYYEKYDWFHIGGDDLFLIVENLRYYLESEEIRTASNGGITLPFGNETMQTPLFLGRRFAYMGKMDEIFNSGGSGYTLNKAALKTLVVKGFPQYFPQLHTFSEDTMVARVLRNYGVFPYETKDEYGGERYMPFMPGHHYGYRIPQDISSDWYAKYSINIKEGADHCAARSVAFHYVKGENMIRLYNLLYFCPTTSRKIQ